MNKTYRQSMRCALALLTAGLMLGGMFAATAHASVYKMKSNYPAGTAAPYNAGGGVPAGAFLTISNQTSTNITLSWYGMMGWYTIMAKNNTLSGPWTPITTVPTFDYAGLVTVPNPDPTNSYSFMLVQSNKYSGQANCSGCHADKYNPWSKTLHASAINEILNPDGSFKPFRDATCLPCHTVGYGQPTGFTSLTGTNATPHLANVGCENCHGPANWHMTTDKNVHPAVSMDPSVCGSCHQGSHHPTFEEYATSGHAKKSQNPATSFGCAFCHQANNRMVMLNEYEDMLAGRSHSLTLITVPDSTNWTATCATCHDPHSTNANAVAQLRYPLRSTNFFSMPTITDVRTVIVTNFNGTKTTNSVNMNTVFDTLYNPNIQVCGQCHNSRGFRWDGTAYSLTTNTVVGSAVTNIVYTDLYTTNTYTQVFTNELGVPYLTNSYTDIYVSGRTSSTVVVTPTNQVVGVGVITPYYYYTNGSTVYSNISSSGYRSAPHPANQYNMLIGILDKDFNNTNGYGIPVNVMHNHGNQNTNQCATCHVPSYAVSSTTNVTGHSFELDVRGCALGGCHTTYSLDALESKIEDMQTTTTNSIKRVVSLLNQWATNVATGDLTNYGQLAWEFSSPGSLGTTNALYRTGPPSTIGANTNGVTPSGTNQNLQLSIPPDIRQARFEVYQVKSDGSLGVHNPTYAPRLLADAENRVVGQFANASYPAYFSAKTLSGFAPLSVAFTNLGPTTGGTWNFGDGGGTNILSPTYIYNTPGTWSVTYTDTTSGKPFTRTAYIRVYAQPTVMFSADNTNILAGQTVTFSNNSTNTADVFLWRWYPQFNYVSGGVTNSPQYDTLGGAFSFTYTNAGTYSVALRASCPGSNRVTVTNVAYIKVN